MRPYYKGQNLQNRTQRLAAGGPEVNVSSHLVEDILYFPFPDVTRQVANEASTSPGRHLSVLVPSR